MKYFQFLWLLIVITSCTEKSNNSTALFSTKKKITIYIQPFQGFSTKEAKEVAKNLSVIYSDVKINAPIPFPEKSWNTAKTRRRADYLIRYLSQKAKEGELIIGLTHSDISTTKNGKSDWGVFGLGFLPGKSCIASTYRLKGNKEEKLFKVAIHELGHTQGLPHCPVKNCFMRDAKGKDYLEEETNFCSDCKQVLVHCGWKLK